MQTHHTATTRRRPRAQGATDAGGRAHRAPRRRQVPERRPATQAGRMGSVDGLRALAIAAVFCYHLDVPWLPSGHLGVIMFLVLTGYLVTSSLLKDARNGLVTLPRFWLRRLARIWLPMAVMVALSVLACVALDHPLLTKARPDVLPGLALAENVSYIVRDVSYFDQIGGPSPLTHLWYVGVDAQFCLIWPVVMYALLATMPSRATTRRITLALALVSAVAMGVLYDPDAGITRVYYGTDTRAFAPLVGAWLAFAMPIGRRPARDLRALVERGRLAIEVAGVLALVALGVAMALIPDTSVALYRGGMLVASLLSAALVATLVLPGGLLSLVLSLPPLAWLGSRSYGIYLWHYPLIQLFRASSNGTPWWKVLLVACLTLTLAELSYRLVERPVSGGTLADSLSGRLAQGLSALRSPFGVAVAACALVVAADAIGLAVVPAETLVPEDAIVSTGEAADKAMDLSDAGGAQRDDQEATADDPLTEVVLRAPSSEVEQGLYDPVLIGDSVPGDAESFWRAACPDSLLDSYVGRRPDQALTVLDEYLAQGVVGKIVILQAFSNMPVTTEQLDHMIEACGPDRIVYLVNVRIPGSEEARINSTLADGAARHDNARLIDWHALSEGSTAWIYPDGEHLTPAGQPVYVDLIANAIASDFEANGGTVSHRSDDDQAQGSGRSVVTDDTA